jgi:hypothetical protein
MCIVASIVKEAEGEKKKGKEGIRQSLYEGQKDTAGRRDPAGREIRQVWLFLGASSISMRSYWGAHCIILYAELLSATQGFGDKE